MAGAIVVSLWLEPSYSVLFLSWGNLFWSNEMPCSNSAFTNAKQMQSLKLICIYLYWEKWNIIYYYDLYVTLKKKKELPLLSSGHSHATFSLLFMDIIDIRIIISSNICYDFAPLSKLDHSLSSTSSLTVMAERDEWPVLKVKMAVMWVRCYNTTCHLYCLF